jgi:regulatory protein
MARTITALKVQKRNPGRINVYLDGDFAFGLARIVAAWLYIGQELSEEKIAELQSGDVREAAHQQALRSLSYRARSEAEIRQNLKEHEFSEPVIEETLERLRKSGLLDDARFAKSWVENRTELRPRSRRALAFELGRKGISGEALDEALAETDDDELAYQAGLKQARKLQSLEWAEFRPKLLAFLARRGFQYSTAAEAVSRIWAEMNNPDRNDHDTTYEEVDL